MQSFTDYTEVVAWLHAQGVKRLVTDSRQVAPGDAFIAWPGAANDGRHYVSQALAAGALCCVVDAAGITPQWQREWPALRIAALAGLQQHGGAIAAAFYGHPSQQLSVIAITGTNGKTSTAWWTAQALAACARPSAVIGTLGIGVPPAVLSTGMTTPDPVRVQDALHSMREQGLVACAIEASSIGIEEQRLAGMQVQVAVFTNFTQDHLDYHHSMESYWQAKRKLFDWPGLAHAVINTDDPQGSLLAQELAATEQHIWTYGLQPALSTHTTHLQAADVRYGSTGIALQVVETQGDQHKGSAPLVAQVIGSYNVSNLLAVIGSLRASGIALADAVQACTALLPVPGRMECLGGQQAPLAVVDYAHTPDALEQALLALRPLAQARAGKLWCVFGCGGDRDPAKRPIMGAIAARYADAVVVTSDNPRSESAQSIVAQVLLGAPELPHVQVEVDRALAIASALSQAQDADVVLIAGKGHESTQEIAGVKHPFVDQAHAAAALAARAASPSTIATGGVV